MTDPQTLGHVRQVLEATAITLSKRIEAGEYTKPGTAIYIARHLAHLANNWRELEALIDEIEKPNELKESTP